MLQCNPAILLKDGQSWKNANKTVNQLIILPQNLMFFHEEEQGLCLSAWELFGLALGIPETAESV